MPHSADQKDRYRLLDNLDDAVIATDGDGRIRHLNPTACELFATETEIDDAIGKKICEALPMEDPAFSWENAFDEADARGFGPAFHWRENRDDPRADR